MKTVVRLIVCVGFLTGFSAFLWKPKKNVEIPQTAKYEYSILKTKDLHFKVEIKKWSADNGEYGVLNITKSTPLGPCILQKQFKSDLLFNSSTNNVSEVSSTTVGNKKSTQQWPGQLPLHVDQYYLDGRIDDIEGDVTHSIQCEGNNYFG